MTKKARVSNILSRLSRGEGWKLNLDDLSKSFVDHKDRLLELALCDNLDLKIPSLVISGELKIETIGL